MKFNTLMIIKAVVCLGFAPLFLFLPSQLLGLYSMTFSSAAALTARIYGASLVGNCLLTRFARNAEVSPIRRVSIRPLLTIRDEREYALAIERPNVYKMNSQVERSENR